MKTGGLECALTRSAGCIRCIYLFLSVNNSIMEDKSLFSGFDLVQPSIKKMVRWFLRRLGEFKSENQPLFLHYFMRQLACSRGIPPNHKWLAFLNNVA